MTTSQGGLSSRRSMSLPHSSSHSRKKADWRTLAAAEDLGNSPLVPNPYRFPDPFDDIATRVIACEVNLDETPVSKVMTRNPVFVLSDTLAVEALQKMVQGKFRHLLLVENGEVIALLDIKKCLYDAIARMERAAEKGKAIAAAVEGVEKQWGTSVSGHNSFTEALRERMFRPSLSIIISENSKVVTIDLSDTVLVAAKKILELRTSSAIVTVDNKPWGVMTPNPECATIDSPIVDAFILCMMDRFYTFQLLIEGTVVSVIDVLHITHADVATDTEKVTDLVRAIFQR
ncbi:CBS domain-containing protein cbscbspb4 [Castilleja foliolosa]|uniref:CBS domain-containing protein cbscbspb4 n=1 Tax=Castilleja foliolosa TaxID=1961234 RepID=A0ABD3ELA0_9LAMI